MRKFSVLLFSFIFLLAVSGIHASPGEHKCECHRESSIPQDNQENRTDCPCVFHSNGVISPPPVLNINFSLVSILTEEIQPFVRTKAVKPQYFFCYLAHAPPY